LTNRSATSLDFYVPAAFSRLNRKAGSCASYCELLKASSGSSTSPSFTPEHCHIEELAPLSADVIRICNAYDIDEEHREDGLQNHYNISGGKLS
jgi:hypothetical protein